MSRADLAPKPIAQLGPMPEGFQVGVDYKAKFIVIKEGGVFTLHIGKQSEKFHSYVVSRITENKLNPDIRVGDLEIKDGKAVLSGRSIAYGGVRKEILELFRQELEKALGTTDIVFDPTIEPGDEKGFELPN